MEQQDYRLITKKSARELRQEGINVDYFPSEASARIHRNKLIGRGRNYTEAFDNLMKELERWQSTPAVNSKFGICNIIEIKDKTLEIILRGDLVIAI